MGCHFKTHLTTSSSLKINKQINNPSPGLFECAGRLGGWRRPKVTSSTSALQLCDCQGGEENLLRSHPCSEGWALWGNCPHPLRTFGGHPWHSRVALRKRTQRFRAESKNLRTKKGPELSKHILLATDGDMETGAGGTFSVPRPYRRKHLLGSPQSPKDPVHCCSPILCLLHSPKELLMFATHQG